MAGGFDVIPPQSIVALSPKGPYSDGSPVSESLGPHGEQLISQYEAPYRMYMKYKQRYFASNQAATTWTVGLALTYTGFCLSNPATSTKNLIVLRLGYIHNAAPTAISSMGIAIGFSNLTAVAHTTPLTVYDGLKALATSTGNGLADAAATLPIAPVYRRWILGGFTAGALPSPDSPGVDESGLSEIQPGGFLIVATPAAITVSGMVFCEWAEIDP